MYHLKNYRYLLSFGSNISPRRHYCSRALKALSQDNIQVIYTSRKIETQPLVSSIHDTSGHSPYINFITEVRCAFPPNFLYNNIIVPIEDQIGHSRATRWAPRKVDIDILLWALDDSEEFIHCSPLKHSREDVRIPHYDLLNRSFLLNLIAHRYTPLILNKHLDGHYNHHYKI